MEIVCPKCNKDDKITKVSSVFTNGVRAESSSGPGIGIGLVGGKIGIGLGGSSSSGISVSQMSMRLRPPDLPKRMGAIKILLISALVYGVLFCLVATLDSSGILGFIAFPLPIIVAIVLFRQDSKSYAEKMDHYSYLKSQWDNLYYCERDDIVFRPGQNNFQTPDQLQTSYGSN